MRSRRSPGKRFRSFSAAAESSTVQGILNRAPRFRTARFELGLAAADGVAASRAVSVSLTSTKRLGRMARRPCSMVTSEIALAKLEVVKHLFGNDYLAPLANLADRGLR